MAAQQKRNVDKQYVKIIPRKTVEFVFECDGVFILIQDYVAFPPLFFGRPSDLKSRLGQGMSKMYSDGSWALIA